MLIKGPDAEEGDRVIALRKRFEYNDQHFFHNASRKPIHGAFAHATVDVLEDGPYEDLIENIFLSRPDLKSTHAQKLLERALQHDLRQNDPTYPFNSYNKVDTWLQVYQDIQDDPYRWNQLEETLRHNSVQSNIAERYKSIKLVAYLLRDRFERPPTVLDVGSSGLHGGLKLAYNRSGSESFVPFGPIQVMESFGESDELIENKKQTKIANWILGHTVEFGQITGVDISNIDDPTIKDWTESCSLIFEERLNVTKVNEYRTLSRLDRGHDRVHFLNTDFVNLDYAKFKNDSPEGGYDIIVFSTIFYQLSESHQVRMLTNASQLLSKKGVIIVQDAPDGNFEQDFNYHTFIIDNDANLEPLLQWESGRCQRVILAQGRFALKGSQHSIEEALEYQVT